MKPRKPRLVFLTVVPSPYQRDLFQAIAQRGHIALAVHYLEAAAPDSPWPDVDPAPWESILRGITLGRGRWRSHLNWNVPAPAPSEVWVVNGAMTDITTQRTMRRLGRRHPWYFWGEQPSTPAAGWRRLIQSWQYAPLRQARGIVAVGQRARIAYQHLAPQVPTFNQPYTCRLEPFLSAAALRSQNVEPVFLFCGQMIARKGIDVLLDAFSELVRQSVPARLQLIGREAELPAWLAALTPPVRARVTYLGFLAPAELPAAFAAADVFVLPSRHDGWGVVVNQALAAGLPVICSDGVGAAHDLLTDEVDGLVVPAGHAGALASAMRRLAQSSKLRQRFASRGAATAQRLAPERAAEFWEERAVDAQPTEATTA